MPVPPGYERKYGLIVGHLQNLGFSHRIAKQKADKAVADLAKVKIGKKPKGK